MIDISNWIALIAGTLTSTTTIITTLNKILDKKFNPIYDNQRLQLRYEICSFAGDLRNRIGKTREEFQAIFEMYDRYEILIKKLNQKNHFIDNEMAYIESQYKLLK